MKKQILILGGTMFVGRMVVEKLRNHPDYEITLFNRGKSNVGLFADVQQLHGNRESDDILQICNRQWDCIIDFSGYYPVTFKKLLDNLKGNVRRYIFISTISVYDLEKFDGRAITVDDPIHSCTEEQKTSKLPDAYGEKKAEMERILLQQQWLDKIILRPSFIYGPYDWTERFYYWLYRAKHNNRILIPTDFSFVLTYAADLASAVINAIQVTNHNTVYNTISQPAISVKQTVTLAAQLLNRQVQFVEPTAAQTEQHGLDYSMFPLYVPLNFSVLGNQWLTDFGVTPTPLNETLQQTIAYHDSLNWAAPKPGLTIEKENEILNQ